MSRPIFLISGGAEAVSIAVAQWALKSHRRLFVYSLVPDSLLEGVEGVDWVGCAPTTEREAAKRDLVAHITTVRAGFDKPVLAIPSEDDSLGLLLEIAEQLGEETVACSRCRALPKGGLDKAILFEFLQEAGLGEFIAETVVLSSEVDVAMARSTLGEELILKPACKPWAGVLASGAKLHTGGELDSARCVDERARDFAAGRRWIAQRKLGPLQGGERSACVVRDAYGCVRYAEVVEWLKYPARGGSACIVETQPFERGLQEATLAILAAVDAVGIVELSFLADANGRPRLLELNVRPWLQIDLLQAAGFDVLAYSERALSGAEIGSAMVALKSRTWLSLERLFLKFVRGDAARWKTVLAAIIALARRPVFPVWGASVGGVRWRWAKRLLGRLVS